MRRSASLLRFSAAALALSAAALLAPASHAAAPGSTVPFLAHQALYELKLTKSRGNANVNAATGRILYNFTGSACEGYSSDFRQVSELNSGEDKTTLSDLRSTSWESGDGKSYRFKIDTQMNDSDPNKIDGIAEREGDHINVKLTLPAKKSIKLDGDIVFPTEQIHRIIAAAKEGKSVLELNVFDGSDTGEKVYSTLTVIGQAIPADRKVAEPDPSTSDDKMKALMRWPVTVSYFDKSEKASDGGEQTPVYAMSFELYENGVSRALALDYNDFVIAGAMSKLMVKETKACK
jgi:EipB-like